MAWLHKENYWYNDRGPFPQWLDKECEDGWEVLKISRDFNSEGQGTWVVFRKEV
jgi:hypothetical protein